MQVVLRMRYARPALHVHCLRRALLRTRCAVSRTQGERDARALRGAALGHVGHAGQGHLGPARVELALRPALLRRTPRLRRRRPSMAARVRRAPGAWRRGRRGAAACAAARRDGAAHRRRCGDPTARAHACAPAVLSGGTASVQHRAQLRGGQYRAHRAGRAADSIYTSIHCITIHMHASPST